MNNDEFINQLKQFGKVKIDEVGQVEFKLSPEAKICTLGCGASIPGQVIEDREYQFPFQHTRKKCMFCKKWQMPPGDLSMTTDHLLLKSEWDKYLRRIAK